jgi:hypothetical protein
MSLMDHSSNGVESASSVLAELVDYLTTCLHAGEPINWDEIARQYPEHIDELRRLLPALGALDQVPQAADQDQPEPASPPALDAAGMPQTLGDFRIVGQHRRDRLGALAAVYPARWPSPPGGPSQAAFVAPCGATVSQRCVCCPLTGTPPPEAAPSSERPVLSRGSYATWRLPPCPLAGSVAATDKRQE